MDEPLFVGVRPPRPQPPQRYAAAKTSDPRLTEPGPPDPRGGQIENTRGRFSKSDTYTAKCEQYRSN